MSEDFAKQALLFAAELFLLSGVVVALAWEAAHMLRRTASLRHLVWAGAFASLLALPALALIVPSQIHFALPAMPSLPAPQETAPLSATATTEIAPVPAAAPQAASFHLHIGLAAAMEGLAALWLAGVFIIALRGLAAAYGLRVLRRQSKAHIFNDVALPEGRYEIRVSRQPNDYGPVTWGIFRPVILLPFAAHFWPRERLEAVLMHEAAHIHRRDSMSQLLSMIVCALYWPNPLVWMAARMLRAEAEMAADDTVLASGFRPSSYAGELLQLASEFRSREPALVGMPLFMAGSALEARVKSVLAPTHRRSGVTKMDVLRICGVALLATAALVIARPTFAQDEPPAPPPAVESAPLPPPAPAETPAPPPAPKPVVSRVTRAGNSAPPAPVAAAVAISAAPADSATPPEPPTPALPAPAPLPATAAAPAPVPADAIDSPYPAVRVREAVRMVHGHQIRRIWIDTHDAQRAAEDAMRRVQPKLERAMREMQRVQPELARAQAEMQAREAELRALQAEQPRIQAQVEAALERVRPEIEKAVAEARLQHMDVKVHEHVDNAMKNAEIRIVIKKRGDAQAKPGEQDNNAPDQN